MHRILTKRTIHNLLLEIFLMDKYQSIFIKEFLIIKTKYILPLIFILQTMNLFFVLIPTI